MNNRLITAADIVLLKKQKSKTLVIPSNAILTPLARDLLKEHAIAFEKQPDTCACESSFSAPTTRNRVIGVLAANCSQSERNVVRKTLEAENVKYYKIVPEKSWLSGLHDAVENLCNEITSGKYLGGIVVDESSLSLKQQAGKIGGIRPVMCWEIACAKPLHSAQEHHCGCQANLLFVNQRLLGFRKLETIIKKWLSELIFK